MDEHTTDETQRCVLYYKALLEMAKEDKRYQSNFRMYDRWSDHNRLWWIEQIEAQAAAGLETVGVHVVTRAMAIRLSQ